MLTLLNQTIEKIGKDNIEKIILRPCDKYIEDMLNKIKGCGLYIVDITLNTKQKYHKHYIDIAYIPIEEGNKFITSRDAKWRGKGKFKGIPVFLALTGGNCVYCAAKINNKTLEETLDYIEKVVLADKYCAYLRPDLKELKKLQKERGI